MSGHVVALSGGYFRANTLMVTQEDRVRVAQEVLRAADGLRLGCTPGAGDGGARNG